MKRQKKIYCNLYKIRMKGQTIKNQVSNKIVEYSQQKIQHNDLKIIIKAAKQIERLTNLTNGDWWIIDMVPNLDINFFRSTSIKDCHKIYLKKKDDDNKLRKDNIKKVYQLNFQDDFSNLPRYYLDDIELEDSLRYYLDVNDIELEDFPRYYPDVDDPMDEDTNNI
ncbi:hypothetical protein C1646_702992 [Rhizophagus diaphanus]|nr:hypothetical protein C1646_702992 [Rhizophagus diaphanus] [Rhizophagus sp. MUCL 43196]